MQFKPKYLLDITFIVSAIILCYVMVSHNKLKDKEIELLYQNIEEMKRDQLRDARYSNKLDSLIKMEMQILHELDKY